MKAEFVGHVRNFVFLVRRARQNLEGTLFGLVALDGRPGVPRLCEAAFEDLHDAMCVCVTAKCQKGIRQMDRHK